MLKNQKNEVIDYYNYYLIKEYNHDYLLDLFIDREKSYNEVDKIYKECLNYNSKGDVI